MLILVVFPKPKIENLLQKMNVNFAQLFIVSKFEIAKDGFGAYKGQDVSIDVLKALGHTCERCWQVVPEVNVDGICPRCENVISE